MVRKGWRNHARIVCLFVLFASGCAGQALASGLPARTPPLSVKIETPTIKPDTPCYLVTWQHEMRRADVWRRELRTVRTALKVSIGEIMKSAAFTQPTGAGLIAARHTIAFGLINGEVDRALAAAMVGMSMAQMVVDTPTQDARRRKACEESLIGGAQ